MNQEAVEILNMVRDGAVSPEQGAELLKALDAPPSAPLTPGGPRPKLVRVRVSVEQQDGEKVAVNANLPIALADLALKMAEGAKITRNDETIVLGDYLKQLGGVDIATILQMVKDGAEGKLVDVNVAEPGSDRVRVEVVVD
jgi:hypothetical protein